MVQLESVTARDTGRALVVATGGVCTLGLCAELGHYLLGLPMQVTALVSLSVEANFPTWYATLLLAGCSAHLVQIGVSARSRGDRSAVHWLALGALFAFLSLDEAIEIHEYLAYVIEGRGLLYFSWIVPASAILLVVSALFVPLVRALAPRSRRRFALAGAIYVGGALGLELPLGLWTEAHGDDNLGYALLDFVEETLEMIGAGGFLVALVDYRAGVR